MTEGCLFYLRRVTLGRGFLNKYIKYNNFKQLFKCKPFLCFILFKRMPPNSSAGIKAT